MKNKLIGFLLVVLSVALTSNMNGWWLLIPSLMLLVGVFLVFEFLEESLGVVDDLVNDVVPRGHYYVIKSILSLFVLVAVIVAVVVMFLKIFTL